MKKNGRKEKKERIRGGRNMKKRWVFVLLCLIGALLVGACSSAKTDGGSAPGIAEDGTIVAADASRKVVYWVSVSMESEDVQKISEELIEECNDLGGYVQEQAQSGGKSGYSQISLVLRIPTEKLDGFMDSMEQTGAIYSKQITAQDITTQYIDAEAYKAALEEQKARLSELLTQTEASASEQVQIISEIAQVDTELQKIQLQLTQYDSQINNSTVRIRIFRDTVDVGTIVGCCLLSAYCIGMLIVVIVLAVRLKKKGAASNRGKESKNDLSE